MKAEDFVKLGMGSIVESTHTENLYRKEEGGWRVLEPGYAMRDLNPEKVTPIVSTERNVFEEFEVGDIVTFVINGTTITNIATKASKDRWGLVGYISLYTNNEIKELATEKTIKKIGSIND